MIEKDFHVHLYGCLRSEDLWNIGKDRYKKYEQRLAWYAKEYEKAWGKVPQYQNYWKENGFELLSKDYEFKEKK